MDATLYACRDGAVWHEAHWIEATALDGPMPKYRVVDIKDGTNEPRPFMVYVMPDRQP